MIQTKLKIIITVQYISLKDLSLFLNKHLYRGPSIDASYQVSIHLAKQFRKRKFLEIDQPETRIPYGSRVC